jgi:hypothetical protein
MALDRMATPCSGAIDELVLPPLVLTPVVGKDRIWIIGAGRYARERDTLLQPSKGVLNGLPTEVMME